jgi:CRISPR-associated endonuclease/helicase Cas3
MGKMNLSYWSKLLWAKTPNKYRETDWPECSWLPLYLHMSDSLEIAKYLWRHWVPVFTKRIIARNPKVAEKIFLFLASLHDVGKATPVFQMKSEELWSYVSGNGLNARAISSDAKNKVPHDIAGHAIVYKVLSAPPYDYSSDEAESFAVIIGGHHGIAPDSGLLDDVPSYENHTGFKRREWVEVQRELFSYAVELSGIDLNDIENRKLSVQAQVILTGLVIMADWIASDDSLFPYHLGHELPRKETSVVYAARAWEHIQFPQHWQPDNIWEKIPVNEAFRQRFGLPPDALPRPIQKAVVDILQKVGDPGIMVIEAPMGEGKTEAALIAAEIMASKLSLGGVFMALPTQATTDGIFPRINQWISTLDDEEHTIYLAHGKARFNKEYMDLIDVFGNLNIWEDNEGAESDSENELRSRNKHQGAIALDWLQGRKKGILSDFVVGTVDQVLMGALKRRHLALRHLGLANKVIIIDEVHSYDAYMSHYLEMELEWLGALGVPVIILSATLPSQKRAAIVDAYMKTKRELKPDVVPLETGRGRKIQLKWSEARAYPLITYSDKTKISYEEIASSDRNTRVGIKFIDDSTLPQIVEGCIEDGGCICILHNTIKRAQETAMQLSDYFDENDVELFHAHFLANDRYSKEDELRSKLGRGGERPKIYIVVGTQVLEQSLDVDFDLLITDIAPIDLIIQRIGRLHRHKRNTRPKRLLNAMCMICGVTAIDDIPKFDSGAEAIYGRYLLEMTYARLMDREEINLPDDISDLVENVYGDIDDIIPESWKADIAEARRAYGNRIDEKRKKAKPFRIQSITQIDTLTDWLNTSVSDSDAHAEATVRDTSDSIEVVVVQKKDDGRLYLLPWAGKKEGIAGAKIPTERTPERALAYVIAGCTVNLPQILCTPYRINRVISEIEKSALPYIENWQDSYWLNGELVLILDEKFETEIAGFNLCYDKKWGLSATPTGTGKEPGKSEDGE